MAQNRSHLPAVFRAARSPFLNYYNTRPTALFVGRVFFFAQRQSTNLGIESPIPGSSAKSTNPG